MEATKIETLMRGQKMERFNENKPCPKCGGKLLTEYRGRFMRRECMRCGYSFNQLPLDAEAPDEP